MPWDFILILVFLGVIVPWRGAVRVRKLLAQPRLESSERLTLYASTVAFQWITTAVVTWRSIAHGIRPRELGLAAPDPWFLALVTFVLSLLILGNQFLGLRRLVRQPTDRQTFLYRMTRAVMPQNTVESLAFVALVVTVAPCEEVVYRGFALIVFRNALGGSVVLGVLLSSVLFALAHLYQRRRGVLTTLIVGAIFAAVRLWTGSLTPTIVAHLAADLMAGLVAPRLLAAANSPGSMNIVTSARRENFESTRRV